MADYIFSMFEYILTDYNVSKRIYFIGDRWRAKTDSEVLEYFTSHLLRNPRLLYYWSKLSSEYGEDIVAYYNAQVLHNLDNPLKEEPDFNGPLVESQPSSLDDYHLQWLGFGMCGSIRSNK
jgi:hypothetical protein